MSIKIWIPRPNFFCNRFFPFFLFWRLLLRKDLVSQLRNVFSACRIFCNFSPNWIFSGICPFCRNLKIVPKKLINLLPNWTKILIVNNNFCYDRSSLQYFVYQLDILAHFPVNFYQCFLSGVFGVWEKSQSFRFSVRDIATFRCYVPNFTFLLYDLSL